MRQATLERKTAETCISLSLCLEGGAVDVQTGCGFFDHMLTLLARHAGFGLTLACRGDLQVDAHHTVEDCGIALGRALKRCLGDCRGIARYGSFLLPMDEALVLVALDISGRCHLACDLPLPAPRVGDFDTELGREFFLALCREAALTLHIRELAGENTHHILEAAFKGVGRALAQAVAPDVRRPDDIPSNKGEIG